MLEAGSHMPHLDLSQTTGERFELEDLRGRESVLIYFMRSESCPVCNSHVKDLARRKELFEAQKIRVIVAMPGESEAAAAWESKHEIPFSVVTGRKGSPHEGVGLTRKMLGSMQQSGTVLIGLDGTVLHAHAATLPAMSYDRKGIAAAVDQLNLREAA